MAISLRALGVVGGVLLLTACGSTPPPAATVAPPSASPTPSATSSPSPSASVSSPVPTQTASSATSAPATPVSKALVLRPKGLDGAAFGTAEGTVAALLNGKAGKPDGSYSGPICEMSNASPYGRQLTYGGAVFMFQSKAKGTSASPRTFTSWVISLGEKMKSSMKLADGYPTNTTFAKLKSAFPAGKLAKVALGESVVYVFRTPSGIWYRGDDNKRPTDLGSGPMGTCE